MINRRQFLRAGAAATAALAWPFRAFPFSQSLTPITKFQATLPGLGPTGANNFGNYIPVLVPDQMTIPGTDLYHVVTKAFTQNLIPNIPTKLWGYADFNKPDLKYLGGVIIATKGVPVQLVVDNQLPAAHILPVDVSLVDQGIVPTMGRTDITAVHLHGGLVFWDSDGGPFSWFSNPANLGGFIHGPSFENSATNPPSGGAIYNYPNGQSARTIWYHDHAYSLTRTNVFAGLASAYLITDDDEQRLLREGVLPGTMPEPVTLVGPQGSTTYELGIPLIIQDKTFWDPSKGDPGYPNAVPPQPVTPIVSGDLWYPHVYEGGLDPDDLPSMTLTDLPQTRTARWGAIAVGGATGVVPEQFPTPSTVPEYFSDTILVNGAPYPTVTVPPRRLRFRFLNASNARFYNLQLYLADDRTPDGLTLVNTGDFDPNFNPIVAPANRPGPAFIQIASEAGFLPSPVLFSADGTNKNSNRVMGHKAGSDLAALNHRRADSSIQRTVGGDRIRLNVLVDPTIGNADRYNLLIAPAERPDVIIDFRDFAGQKLILYNDAPAPFPGGDIRNDYYVGDPDLTSIGGAPTTQPLLGPDTRILMRFEVAMTGGVQEMSFADTLTALNNELPTVFAARGDPQLPLPQPPQNIGKSLIEDNEDGTSMPLPFGRLRQLLGDGAGNATTLLETPIDFATVGEVQYWDIYNLTADTHPMHFHLVNVNVIRRAQWEFDDTGLPVIDTNTGNIAIIPGTDRPPDPNEMGWKETVRMNPGEVTTVAMRFDLPPGTVPPPSPRFANTEFAGASEYVWHCHILEHEEHDMMHPLLVMPAGFVASRRQ
jgi:spore coat protein A